MRNTAFIRRLEGLEDIDRQKTHEADSRGGIIIVDQDGIPINFTPSPGGPLVLIPDNGRCRTPYTDPVPEWVFEVCNRDGRKDG